MLMGGFTPACMRVGDPVTVKPIGLNDMQFTANGQGRQHQDDNGKAGPVYAGLAWLFRLLRNARGAGRPHSLGPVAEVRLRAALWRQWKTPRRRRAALVALGVSGELRNMAGSGRGPWHLARSKAEP
jgi:hypothetical protein